VARWHAEHGGAITNRWHHEVILPDDDTRRVLAHADGTLSVEELAERLGPGGAGRVRACLQVLAAAALLVG
jgi:hypothetical protein